MNHQVVEMIITQYSNHIIRMKRQDQKQSKVIDYEDEDTGDDDDDDDDEEEEEEDEEDDIEQEKEAEEEDMESTTGRKLKHDNQEILGGDREEF